ncbi:MAG: endonuclease [Bacillota bacterium]
MKKLLTLFLMTMVSLTLFACNITPDDQEPTFTLTLTSNPSEAMTIASPDLDTYPEGTTVSVNAEDLDGYTFLHWLDETSDEIVSTELFYTFDISEDTTLQAVYEINDGDPATVDVTVQTNIDDINIPLSDVERYIGDSFTITAPDDDPYFFAYWVDLDTGTTLSHDATFETTLDGDLNLVAMYYEEQNPTSVFFTDFESLSKTSFDSGVLTIDTMPIEFNDALIGGLDNDKKVANKSVRIRNNGYLETQQPIENLSRIAFEYAYYGTESGGTITIALSDNQSEWVDIETIETGASLEFYELLIDDTLLTTNDLNPEDGHYIKIYKSDDQETRVNIDNLDVKEIVRTIPPFDDINDDEIPNNSTLLDILVDDTVIYSVGDEWTGAACSVLNLNTEVETDDCEREGSVDTSTPGEYFVTYYKVDSVGNYASETVTEVVLTDASLLDIDYTGYYDGIEGLYGEDLLLELRNIINDGFVGVSYGDSRYILDETDQDPDNSDNLILVYDGTSINSGWDAGATWNREHVWPQSYLVDSASNSAINHASDLHNLKPADPGENSSRGNKYFDWTETSETYEPRDDVKGDIARIMFYMTIMYDEYELVNTYPVDNEMGHLDTLVEWHYFDPVDAFEENRNEIIYDYQFNRNPLIDHPHLLELLYFDNDYYAE